MPAINYNALPEYLEKTDSKNLPAVLLIHGEEFLYKKALENLLNTLFAKDGTSARLTGYESLDGSDQSIPAAIEKLNTYSLLSGDTVVGLADARIFDSKQDRGHLLNSAKTAFESDDIKKAGRYLASVMGLAGLTFDDLSIGDAPRLGAAFGVDTGDADWLVAVVAHLIENKVAVPTAGSGSDTLATAIANGFAGGNRLVITTDVVDKRRRLYKTILEKGLIIDCAVPKGDRRDERMTQQTVMTEQMQAFLKKRGKTVEQKAYGVMAELTGFDLRTMMSNLEKLTAYVGERSNITAADVSALLTRTKADPIYALTNAVAERDLSGALFSMRSLLDGNLHSLQIFTAIANQMRKLLLAKGFVKGPKGGTWRKGADFNYFRSQVLPQIVAHDQNLQASIDKDDELLAGQKEAATTPQNKAPKKKAAKKKKAIDLALAPNPKNAYPIYQLILKSDNFTLDELLNGFAQINETDLKLKTSTNNPEIVLEKLIFNLCRPV
jgi:DNA polymerase III subunit delta